MKEENLLQEKGAQFASHCGEALLSRRVITGVHQSKKFPNILMMYSQFPWCVYFPKIPVLVCFSGGETIMNRTAGAK